MRRAWAAVALTLAGVGVGCAADVDDPEPVRPLDALTWEAGVAPEGLDAFPIAVGSQSQPVDEVLGWIAVEALTAAGADVTEDLSLGDTQATREAQLAGLIDLYWETTGTGWLSLLREIGPSQDPGQLWEDLSEEDLEENGIVWLRPAPADAGAVVVASPEVIDEREIDTLAELAGALDEREEGVVVCVSSVDQPVDPAAIGALADTAEVRIRPRLVVPVPPPRLVELTEAGTFCPFALMGNLDPRLSDADLEALTDDLGAFVAEQPAVTVREDTFDLAPGIDDLFAPVSEALDTETLRGLVGRVTQDGDDPREVARDWLVEEGLASS